MSHAKRCARTRADAYRALIAELGWSHSKIGRLFDRDQSSITKALTPVARFVDASERLDDLERQLRRLTGVEFSHELVVRFSIPSWMAIFLAIAIEAYPRVLPADNFCELYDEALNRLGRSRPGSDFTAPSYAKKFASEANKSFRDQGLPEPIRSVRPFGYTLHEDAAHYLALNIGRPFIPAIAAHRMVAA